MAAEKAQEAQEHEATKSRDESKRERSTIDFPYGDLSDAEAVAKGVHGVSGSSCEWEQLAAKLEQAPLGGGFRQRMLTAKAFGLVTYTQGKVTLTPLGSKINDPKKEKAARAEAFLAVELYKAVYDKFKGGVLPPTDALEAEMVALGVAKKQSGKARQYFQRSAQQGGFFWSGQDRLVYPAIKPDADDQANDSETKDNANSKGQNNNRGSGGGGRPRHPLIEGLMRELPEEKTPFPMEAQKNWLQLASSLFKVIYESPDDGRASLKIEIQKDSSK